eukprot:COSAG04_NODE_18385_length_443_cov_0.898256_2_plen_86_part_01
MLDLLRRLRLRLRLRLAFSLGRKPGLLLGDALVLHLLVLRSLLLAEVRIRQVLVVSVCGSPHTRPISSSTFPCAQEARTTAEMTRM